MAIETLLSEFAPISTDQWEHSIREKIAGTEYASKLIWHPEEGLAVKPYYRADDLEGLDFLDAAPGVFSFVRGARSTGDWRIREEINVVGAEDANRAARAALLAGAEEIAFRQPKLESPCDLAALLANLDEVPIALVGSGPTSIRLLMKWLTKHPHGSSISADLDPLDDIDLSAELIRNAPPGFRPFVIHAEDFGERGAGSLEEVSLALSAAVDFVAEIQDRGVPVGRSTASLSFSFAMGPKFFIEIAKLRGFRLVWSRAIESFGDAGDAARPAIHARTAHWNTTLYDPQTNILRATTEAISAELGGAESITVSAFDDCFRLPDESSRRLARNTQIILKQEAFLSRVADPLGGSYMIEALTHSIASKAWKLFQELETSGGYRRARAAGVIASVLDKRESLRGDEVARRRCTLAGTNRFADATEHALERVDGVHCNTTSRAAEPFETLRLRTERFTNRTGKQPCIVLAEVGEAKMRDARARFAADFLACAGLVSSKSLFACAGDIADCAANVIVLCGSDAEYLSIATELMPILKLHHSPAKVIIAGNPDTAEQLRQIGVFDFIHLRSNAVEVLARIQQVIGIED